MIEGGKRVWTNHKGYPECEGGCGRLVHKPGATCCARCKPKKSEGKTISSNGDWRYSDCIKCGGAVRNKGCTTCSICRETRSGYLTKEERESDKKIKMIERAIAPQSLAHMSPEHIIKHWNKVQI